MKKHAVVGLLAALAACCASAGGASAAVTSSFSGGTLTVTSDGAGDSITITCGSAAQVNNVNVAGSTCAGVTTMTINGNGGNDTIDLQSVSGTFPNASTITINGGNDVDFLIGSQRADTMNGDAGADTVYGNGGGDTITTSDEGGDTDFDAGTGTDRLVVAGGLADGVVVGASSITTNSAPIPHTGFEAATFNTPSGEPTVDLTDAPWPSTVNGGAGNETVYTSAHNDILNLAGQGIEDIVATRVDSPSITVLALSMSGTGVGNDTLNNVERVRLISPTAGGSGPPVNSTWDASAFSGKVEMIGGSGNDTLIGGSGNDLLGEPSPNPLSLTESGDDTFTGNGGSNQARGGEGTDTLRATAVTSASATASSITVNGSGNTLSGVERAQLTGTGSGDLINLTNWGGQAVLDGSGGGDSLTGGSGDDRITGGPGTEVGMDGNGGTDTLAETAGVSTSATIADGTLTGFPAAASESFGEIERVELTGSSGSDSFDATGFSGVAILDGRGSADTITGGSGADTLLGGADADTINAQTDNAADAAIDCGSETDIANVDLADPATIGCETVNKPSVPDPGTGSGSGSTPADLVAPSVSVTAGRVNRRGRFQLRFACPAAELSCSGSFLVFAKNRKGKAITVGRGSYTAQGGDVAVVTVTLSRAGRALLRARRKLRVTVSMTAADAAGNSGTTTTGLTLRPKK